MENMKWVLAHTYNLLSGFLVAFLGYFAPIKGVFHLMVIAIIIDLITGVIASRMAGYGIKSLKLWRTIYKLVLAVIVISLAFALDKELGMVQIHRFIAWLIIGFELWSIFENAGKITNHKIFRALQHFMEDKVKSTTGIDIKDESK